MNRSRSLVRWSSGCRTMACPEGVSCSHPSSFVSVSRVSYAALATRAGPADGSGCPPPISIHVFIGPARPSPPSPQFPPSPPGPICVSASPPISTRLCSRSRPSHPDPRPSPPSVSICLGRLQQSGAPLASPARRIAVPYPLRGGRPNVCNTRLITSSDQS